MQKCAYLSAALGSNVFPSDSYCDVERKREARVQGAGRSGSEGASGRGCVAPLCPRVGRRSSPVILTKQDKHVKLQAEVVQPLPALTRTDCHGYAARWCCQHRSNSSSVKLIAPPNAKRHSELKPPLSHSALGDMTSRGRRNRYRWSPRSPHGLEYISSHRCERATLQPYTYHTAPAHNVAEE